MNREAVASCGQCHQALDEVNMLKMRRKRPWRVLVQARLLDPDVGEINPQTGLPWGATLFGNQQMYDFCSEQCRKVWITGQQFHFIN